MRSGVRIPHPAPQRDLISPRKSGLFFHIFPKNYLKNYGFESDRDRNQTANFTYLDYATNIDISDDPPIEYVGRYREKLGEEAYRRSCREHALPEDFQKMEYPRFLELRRTLMAQVVKTAYQKLCEQ